MSPVVIHLSFSFPKLILCQRFFLTDPKAQLLEFSLQVTHSPSQLFSEGTMAHSTGVECLMAFSCCSLLPRKCSSGLPRVAAMGHRWLCLTQGSSWAPQVTPRASDSETLPVLPSTPPFPKGPVFPSLHLRLRISCSALGASASRLSQDLLASNTTSEVLLVVSYELHTGKVQGFFLITPLFLQSLN